jgi:hypothetical protein
MPPLRYCRQIGKKRRDPLLQQIALEPKPALAPTERHVAGDQ